MTDVAEIVERIEAATGPDREIDLLIHEARGLCAHRKLEREECDNDHYDLVCAACGTDSTFIKERYTASLDAAMTLVPEGLAWGAGAGTNDAEVEGWAWCGPGEGPYSFAGIPALALCAAALRAHLLAKDQNHG